MLKKSSEGPRKAQTILKRKNKSKLEKKLSIVCH